MIILKNNDIYLCYLNNPCCHINNYFLKTVKFTEYNIIYASNKSLEEVDFNYDNYRYYHCNLKGAIDYFNNEKINLDNVLFITLLNDPFERYISLYDNSADKNFYYKDSKTLEDDFNRYILEENHFKNFFPYKFRTFKKHKIDNLIRVENFENDIISFCQEHNINFELNKELIDELIKDVNIKKQKYIFKNKSIEYIDYNFNLDFIEYKSHINPYYKNTFAILIPVFNEYSYINFFIEYHKNLGFDKFYILIDDSSDIQPDYKIKENLLPYIKFYRLTNIYSQKQINDIMFNSKHKSKLVHTALQYIFTEIVEDYVITLGADSFLYLNELNIRDFLFKNNIDYQVIQIFFNWIKVFNKNIDSQYNILNELNSENYTYCSSDHFFTLCQKKHIENLDITSHFYKCKPNIKNICWCNNEIFILDYNNVFNDIINFKKNDYIPDYGCIIHFIFRNIKDIFIKSYYSWNNDKKNISKMINDLINNKKKPDQMIGTGFRLDYLHHLRSPNKKSYLKFNFNYKSIDININLFDNMLNETNINEKTFMKWLDEYIT
jgi:hypothetical protein